MNKASIIIMGKTGAGKSTIVNAVMEDYVAPEGEGRPVTQENKRYTRVFPLGKEMSSEIKYEIVLCDTVGLELNSKVTENALDDIRKEIEKTQNNNDDANLVWFCVSSMSACFENYEVALIKKLVFDYEIPFIMVITKCFSEEKGDLEKQIERDLPELIVMRILAKDYETTIGVEFAFGLSELLESSIFNYSKLKVQILKSKLEELENSLHISEIEIERMNDLGKKCVEKYAKRAAKLGWASGLSIIPVHAIFIKTISKLNKIFGITTKEGLGIETLSNIIVGAIATPFISLPGAGAIAAYVYVSGVCETYMNTLTKVVRESTYADMDDAKLMTERIKSELKRVKQHDEEA